MVEVGVGRGDSVPIQLNTSSFSSFCGLLRVTLDDGSFFIMVGDPSAMVLEAVDEVLASPRVDTEVKEFCIGIPFFEVCDTGSLSFPSTLRHRKGNDFAFEPSPKVNFFGVEGPRFLSNVQSKNDIKGHVELYF